MATGDPAEAAALGGQALDWAGAVRSHRVAENPCELSRFGQPHEQLNGVAEFDTRAVSGRLDNADVELGDPRA